MDQPDEDNSYEDMNCNHVNIYLIPNTYKRGAIAPVAPCGSAAIDYPGWCEPVLY